MNRFILYIICDVTIHFLLVSQKPLEFLVFFNLIYIIYIWFWNNNLESDFSTCSQTYFYTFVFWRYFLQELNNRCHNSHNYNMIRLAISYVQLKNVRKFIYTLIRNVMKISNTFKNRFNLQKLRLRYLFNYD